jgi:peptide methionine sulfoxide reductase MsrA
MDTKKNIKKKIKQMLEKERYINSVIAMSDGDRVEYFRMKDEHTKYIRENEYYVNQIILDEQKKLKKNKRNPFF